MNFKIIKISLVIFFLFSLFFIISYYFSDKNISFINKSRASFFNQIDNTNLLTLKSDTNDIIIYKNDVEDFKNKRKKRFWEKLISSKNE